MYFAYISKDILELLQQELLLLNSLLGFSVICVTYTHVLSNHLCKSLLRKYTALDNKILCFLLLNKSLGKPIVGKHWTKNDSIGESVIDIFSHTYVVSFISMFLYRNSGLSFVYFKGENSMN